MRFLRVRLENVRGIDACDVHFARDGVTIVEAPNETGKTTLMDAVDVLLEYKDGSRAKPVRDLEPAGTNAASTIEVELVCGDTHLTCTKTFNRQTATVLRIHTPTTEQLSGDAAHDRLRAILDAEVDLDLFAALRFDQGRDLSAVGLQGSHVLADRLDAVAGGEGGGDGDALLERVQAEHRRYFTPGGKEGKVLTEADAKVERLAAEHEQVRQELHQLAAHVDELATIDEELPRLRRRLDEEIHGRLAELEQQQTAIGTRAEVVATRRAERASAEAAAVAARRDRDDRAAQVVEVQELREKVEALEGHLAPTQERRAELEAQLADLDHELQTATTAAADARTAGDAAQVLADLVQARGELAQLARRHERVQQVQADAREAEAALAAIALDDDRLAAIREAERDRAVAAATLAAGAPTVTVQPQRPLSVIHDGTTAELQPGGEAWSAPISDRFHLDVPEVVTVEVRAGGSAGDLHRAVQEAEAEVARRCRDAGVRDPEHAEQVGRERAQHLATLERRDEALARELEGTTPDALAASLHDAQTRVDALTAALPATAGDGGSADAGPPAGQAPAPPGLELDAADARRHLDEARRVVEAAAASLAERRAARDAVGEELTRFTGRVATDEAALGQQREQLARDLAALEEARAEASDDDLQVAARDAEERLAAAEQRLREAQEQLDELDPDAVELDVQNWRHQRDDCQQRITEFGERRVRLQTQLEVAGQQGLGEREQTLEQELERARADQRRLRARAAAADLLHTELTRARDEVYRAYRAPLVERIVEQARLLYRRDDVSVELGDELQIVRRHLDGVTLDWDQLSAGAREQLAILSALAAAQLAGGDGVPFVLDDALGYTDPQRLERLGALLGRTTDAQVIVLTCVADRFRHVGGATVVRLLEARADGATT
jgi:DNA repair exonuclease SbcCD ATPase subunit